MDAPRRPDRREFDSPTDDWDTATWGDTLEGDTVLSDLSEPWEVTNVNPRTTSHKVSLTNGERTFTFIPEHALPVRRRRGEMGSAFDLLAAAFGPLEILE